MFRFKNKITFHLTLIFLFGMMNFATCKYGFKDVAPIPVDVKTFRVNYLENKAQYINTRLSPELTEKLKQKVIGTTRLRQTNSDDAHYDISGFVSQYYVTMVSVSGNNNTGNRLSVGFHLIFKNSLDEKKNFETDLSRSYDFKGDKSLSDIDRELNTTIVSDLVDEIFNKIFSNW
ncbi:MAG: LPS assembly lipoprotein LptE [Ferruginibacter sp.]